MVAQVFEFLEDRDMLSLCMTTKQMWSVYMAWGMSELENATELLRDSLFSKHHNHIDGDEVSIEVREYYIGGAQPVDGDLVSVSPLLGELAVRRGQAISRVEVWEMVNGAVEVAMERGMDRLLFVNVDMSWKYREHFDGMYVAIPEKIAQVIHEFEQRFKRVLTCVRFLLHAINSL